MFRHQKNSRNGSRKGRIQRQFRLTTHHDGRSRSARNLFTVNRLKQAAFKASEESAQTIFFSFPLFSAVDPCNFIPSGMMVKPLKVIKQRYLKWRRFLPLWNDLKCGNEACLIPTFIPTFWHKYAQVHSHFQNILTLLNTKRNSFLYGSPCLNYKAMPFH